MEWQNDQGIDQSSSNGEETRRGRWDGGARGVVDIFEVDQEKPAKAPSHQV